MPDEQHDAVEAGDDVPSLHLFPWSDALTGSDNGTADDEATIEHSAPDAFSTACTRFFAVQVPAETAHELGFIDRAHATRLIDTARANTSRRMTSAISRAPAELRPALTSAMDNPVRFAQMARGKHLRYREALPLWGWYVQSLPREVEEGTCGDRLRWLTAYVVDLQRRELERSMEEASMAAARKFGYLYDLP